ncbi:hypothetical protein TraAM80_07743 [Trypanosoma rangeli]|uniref:Uncharacterized protein n=1 Tax=Trypanosoma rangeli TaxID=5698 RepID=A0A422N4L1_TRYRA|nr:uncharacterized protein TraAM80_07743 [Trypanosoma rangeli]RNF00396.1 hypothetical protein TraAM80_07743 [Trypanosoma rangeli]|eukprot:RNF00396.1 hypothetical protein TraAM80_07743 [Trypanosoma rangeli]
MLLSSLGEDALLHLGEGTLSTACANDIALVDSAVLTSALPGSSGFVTIRRTLAAEGKDPASGRGSGVWPPVTPRVSGRAHGDSPSPCTASASTGLAASPAAAVSASGVLAAMTPIITCGLGSKCWPRLLSHAEPATDTQPLQYFKEAVVVPVTTMRLLGVEEGALVQLNFHSEEKVLEASTVLFALMSDGVGEELSFDSYMRHFIAPFFIQRRRAISVAEEFEIKNHGHGQLHVTVMAIDDGLLKSGILVDDTCVRLVVQPAAPPHLQGQEGTPTSKNPTPRGRTRSACSGRSPVRESSEPPYTQPGALAAAPRENLLPGVGFSPPPRDHHPILGRPPRVYVPSPRLASRSAEPHSGPASFPTYLPQTMELREVQIVQRKHLPTSCTAVTNVRAAAESDAGADLTRNAHNTGAAACADAAEVAAANAVAATVEESGGVSVVQVTAYQRPGTSPTTVQAPAPGGPGTSVNVTSTEAPASPSRLLQGKRELSTQRETHALGGEEAAIGSGGSNTTEPILHDPNTAAGVPMQKTDPENKRRSPDAVSNVMPHHDDFAEATELRSEQLPTLSEDAACRAHRIVESWLAVKAQWRELSISHLLKCESHVAIKVFQHFLAVYKELKQRHTDCLAYLDSPYGHTVRGDLVLRVSLLAAARRKKECGSAVEPLWRRGELHDEDEAASVATANDDVNSTSTVGVSSESQTVFLAAKLLRLSLRELSAALGRDVLHVFRVGGTCPMLYCTLMKRCSNGPHEVTLLGEPCPVEVLRTTILEDICEAREESRREWVKLSTMWKGAVSGVLQLGVFTKHLQTVRHLFLELARLLHYPDEVWHSASYWRRVYAHPPRGSEGKALAERRRDVTSVSRPTPATKSFTEKVVAPSIQCEEFLPYLHELQDTYYLFVELLEPFVLHSMQRLNTVSALTDTMQCSPLVEFLRISHRAQLADEEACETGTPVPSAAVEAEREAFLALVEARKAGAVPPLPTEWWETNGEGDNLKFLR